MIRLTIRKRFACLPLALLIAACAAPATPTPTATALPPTGTATLAPTDTATPVPPTDTPRPPSTATPTLIPTPSGTPAATETATVARPTSASSGDPFSPKLNSVWDLERSQYVIADACSGGPLPNLYGLVQITPQGDTLALLDQAGTTYTFSRTRPNTFSYSGHYSDLPASGGGSATETPVIGDGSVAMTLEFTSTTTLVMQRVFTLDSDPACQITDDYTGVKQWDAQ